MEIRVTINSYKMKIYLIEMHGFENLYTVTHREIMNLAAITYRHGSFSYLSYIWSGQQNMSESR